MRPEYPRLTFVPSCRELAARITHSPREGAGDRTSSREHKTTRPNYFVIHLRVRGPLCHPLPLQPTPGEGFRQIFSTILKLPAEWQGSPDNRGKHLPSSWILSCILFASLNISEMQNHFTNQHCHIVFNQEAAMVQVCKTMSWTSSPKIKRRPASTALTVNKSRQY